MSSTIHIVRAQFNLNDRLKERLANPLDSFDVLPEFKRFMKTREPYNNYIHSLPCRPRSFSPGTSTNKNDHTSEWGQQLQKQHCSSGFPQHSPLTNAFFLAAKENHSRKNENNYNNNKNNNNSSNNNSNTQLNNKKKQLLWRTPSPSHPSPHTPIIPHTQFSNMHLLKSSEMIEKSSPFLLQIKAIQLKHDKELPIRMINTAPERNNRDNNSSDSVDIENYRHYNNTDDIEQLDESAIVFVKTRNRFRSRNICQNTHNNNHNNNDGEQQYNTQQTLKNAVFVPPMRIFRIQSSAENTQQQQQRATTANNKSIRILKKNNSTEKPHNDSNNSLKRCNQDNIITNPGSSSDRNLSKGCYQQQQQNSRPVSPKIQQSLQILQQTDRIFVRGVKLHQNQAID